LLEGVPFMLSESVARKLVEIVGVGNYLDSPEDRINYSYDGFIPECEPEVVLFPRTTEQVSAILETAWAEGIAVTARGAGTNIVGGTVPMKGGMVLCFTRMNRILEIHPVDRFAVVQPGLVNSQLQAAVAEHGLFYPPDPASLNVSTLGGNVAENAGGPRGVKYGVTRDYLLGLTVVLADGRVIRTGGRTTKNVTGYDLTGLFCGSEGTLGVITEITVRLISKPETQRSIQAAFSDLDHAGQTVARIMAAGILPVALELMDSVVMNLIEDSHGIGLPRDAEGLLLIQVDGPQETVSKEVTRIAQFCRDQGAKEVKVSRTQEEDDILWMARRSAFGVMARSRPNCIVEDVTVAVSRLPTMVRDVVALARKHGVTVGVLAHAGDGNMHPLILCDRRDAGEWHRVEEFSRELFERAVELGGTLSGEHGIGLAKDRFLPLVMNEETRSLMREIKAVLDPRGILNPGKFV
jgi:glycolate oxidase